MRVRYRLGLGTGILCVIATVASTSGSPKAPLAVIDSPPGSNRLHYRIDAAKSRLLVETHTTGLASMFGHDHEIAVRAFSGTVSLVAGAPETASVDLTVQADSLALLDKDVNDRDRRDVERMIRKALDTAKYKRISFRSTGVTTEMIGPDVYQVELAGELLLRGVRNQLTVPAQVVVERDTLRVTGTCKLRQTDYKIVPASFANGTVGVRDDVTLTFDLVADASPDRRRTTLDPCRSCSQGDCSACAGAPSAASPSCSSSSCARLAKRGRGPSPSSLAVGRFRL
jgi:polyisoprenoid-binding protein YceI